MNQGLSTWVSTGTIKWKKKSTHPLIWCLRIFLPVCLSLTNVDPNYLGTGRIEWAEFFKGIFDKMMNLHLTRTKNQSNFFATFSTRAALVSLFLLQKQLICDFLAENNYPYLPNSEGGLIFGTQNFTSTNNVIFTAKRGTTTKVQWRYSDTVLKIIRIADCKSEILIPFRIMD